jgi:hypothetical protein
MPEFGGGMTRLLAIGLLALWTTVGIAHDAKDKLGKGDAEKIEKLIGELDSKTSTDPAKAVREIIAFGKPALPVLEKAAKNQANDEVARRLGIIIWKLRAPASDEEIKKIAAEIRLLNRDQFEEREAATNKLGTFGKVALSQLYEATFDRDAETAFRALVVIDRLLKKKE